MDPYIYLHSGVLRSNHCIMRTEELRNFTESRDLLSDLALSVRLTWHVHLRLTLIQASCCTWSFDIRQAYGGGDGPAQWAMARATRQEL